MAIGCAKNGFYPITFELVHWLSNDKKIPNWIWKICLVKKMLQNKQFGTLTKIPWDRSQGAPHFITNQFF